MFTQQVCNKQFILINGTAKHVDIQAVLLNVYCNVFMQKKNKM